MLPGLRSHRCTRLFTSCSISAAGIRSPADFVGPILCDQRARDIITVARALPNCMARRHPVPVAIKQHASEEARLPSFSAIPGLGVIARKLRMDCIPPRLIDDWLVFAGIGLLIVNNLTQIDAVLQHQVERAAREWLPTRDAALVRNLI